MNASSSSQFIDQLSQSVARIFRALGLGIGMSADGRRRGPIGNTARTFSLPLVRLFALGLFIACGSGKLLAVAPNITSSLTATGQVGVAFSYQIVGNHSPTSYSATGLPSGLTVSTTTGLISGTPTVAATSNVTIGATNSSGTGTATLVLTVKPPKPVITSATTATGQVGVAFSYQITATNSPTSYSASGLPAGLSVNTSTGVISGTPTATGTSNITIGATNTGGTGNATVAVTTNVATPVITSATTATGQVGVAFSYQITASNSPTSYSASNLPAGLSVNTSTGAISGTPTAGGTSSVTIGATNAGGPGTATLSLTVTIAPPVITSPTTATGQVGTAFSYQTTATNNPTSYSASGLPGGLSVSASTGVISGTPIATGTSSVTIGAINAGGTGTATLTLTVSLATQAAVTSAGGSAVSPNTFTAVASGGSGAGAYSFQLVAGGTAAGGAVTSGGVISATSTGTVLFQAMRAGDSTYSASAWSPTYTVTFIANNTAMGHGGTLPISLNSIGNNSYVVFAVVYEPIDGAAPYSSYSATFDGTAMAQIASTAGFGGRQCIVFGLPIGSKAAGTYNLTFSGSIYSLTTASTIISGISQTSSVGTPVSNAAWASSFTLSPASTVGDTVIMVGGYQSGTTIAYGSGQTLFADTGSSSVPGGVSISAKPGIASVTPVSYTLDVTTNCAATAFALHPAPALAAPTISSFTASPTTINSGQSSTLSWSVSGNPAPSLSIDNGVGAVSGTSIAVSPSATILYTLTATNTAGMQTATLTVAVNTAVPVITSATSATGQVGAAFGYQITASNSPTSYSATGLPGGLSVNTSTGVISGSPTAAGTSSVTIGATNAGGTGTATLILTVNPAPVAPTITTQPQSLTITAGATATFAVVATGNPALTYQWRKDGVDISGATSASYSKMNAQTPDAGTYTVYVSNSVGGIVSNPATLSVIPLAAPSTGALAVSQSHAVILKSNGTVWAWGFNACGQLGDGTTTQRWTPVQVSGLTSVVAVAAYQQHTVALKSDGTVWTWGLNSAGQLGDGTTTQRTTPVLVSGLNGMVAVSAGEDHTVALKGDGSVWTWGSNSTGQLGDGTTVQRTTAGPVNGLTGVVAIAAGRGLTFAVKNDGTLWAWGANYGGMLGDGTTIQQLTPVQVVGLTGVTSVTAGNHHTLAIKNDGTLWAWGYNSAGQLGDGTKTPRTTPIQVTGLTGVVSVAPASYYTLAVKNDGTLWAWGSNSSPGGLLGDGTTSQQLTPTQVPGETAMLAVAGFGYYSLALKSDGTLRGWGEDDYGYSGDGTLPLRITAVQATSLTTVTELAVCYHHNVALTSDGTVWGWGSNFNGQVGDGTTLTKTAAAQVVGLTGMVAVAAGQFHSVALKSDGTVWAWGSNGMGQLGDGTTTQRLTRVQVSGLSGVIAVSCGANHTVALKSDGSVWAWGWNYYGQLGDGTTTQRLTPVQVSGLTGATAIAAGGDHTAALKPGGAVWAWGNNSLGQLGDGTTTLRITPVLVSGLTNVVTIALRDYHTVALKGDGTVWTCGRNDTGQLGDGTTSQRNSPVQASGLSGVIAVAAGTYHTAVVKSDGTVWTCGSNGYGQLGDGTTQDRLLAVQAVGLTGVTDVAADDDHTVALKSDGTLRACGYNDDLGLLTQPAIRLIAWADDADQDGMSDAWETQHFGNLTHNGATDTDGDGLTDVQEYLKGSDPTKTEADGDLLTDLVDNYPTDYYNGVTPTLTILSGNNQSAAPGQFNVQPFDIAVWNSLATAPLVNAPVTFAVTQGGGSLATTNTGNPQLLSNLTIQTDADGTAQLFYKQPPSANISSQITVTAGNAAPVFFLTQNFTQGSGDSDGNGLGDAWEQQYFGHLGVDPSADPDGDGVTNLQEFLLGRNPTKAAISDTTGAVNLRVYSPSR